MSETGPVLTQWLEPASDRLWVVDRNGAFALASIRGISAGSEMQACRLLTAAGDIVLSHSGLAMTADGPLTGDEIAARLQAAATVRLDIVVPTDLPAVEARIAPTREIYRSCLATLPEHIIQLPRADGLADALRANVEHVLEQAEVRATCIEDERWITFVLPAVKAERVGCRAGFDTQADVLAMTTAWAAHAEGIESRIRLGDHRLRRRLLAALAGAARSFEVKWLPGYHPVDSRIRPLGDREWPARVPVHAAIRGTARVVTVELGTSGDPIVNLAIVTSAAH